MFPPTMHVQLKFSTSIDPSQPAGRTKPNRKPPNESEVTSSTLIGIRLILGVTAQRYTCMQPYHPSLGPPRRLLYCAGHSGPRRRST